jgi:hypothetical protein
MPVTAPYELPAGPARTRRPARPRPVRPGERIPAGALVPVEAAGTGDTQVLAARFPGRYAEPVIDLAGLADLPAVTSVVASTDVRASRPLPAVRELILAPQTPVPDAGTLANLPGLRTLYAPLATSTRRLAVPALPGGLAELALSRGCLADTAALGQLTGLRSLEIDLYPGDSVQPVGKLTGLVRLAIGGPRVTGWRALAGCVLLEEALLNGLTGANLRPFAGWTRLRRLTVTRRGLASLTGIERLGALSELDLRMLAVADLTPLATLAALRSLRLIGLQAAHDLSPLAALSGLRRLEVSRAGIEESDVVTVDSLRPLSGLAELEEAVLDGTVVADGDFSPLAGLPRLSRLRLYAAAGPAVQALRARHGLQVQVDPGPAGPAELAHGLPIRGPAADGWWSLRADLAGRLDVETNADAEKAVLTAVASRDPALARRLSTDSEADAVDIRAADPADLRAVAAIIAALPGPVRPNVR